MPKKIKNPGKRFSVLVTPFCTGIAHLMSSFDFSQVSFLCSAAFLGVQPLSGFSYQERGFEEFFLIPELCFPLWE